MKVNQKEVQNILNSTKKYSDNYIRSIFEKAKKLNGLNVEEISIILNIPEKSQLMQELFDTAKEIKDKIYGNRLVLFAPLYISNLCNNECLYCAFRSSNKSIERKTLSQQQIADQTQALIKQGHKRILLVAGESYPKEGLQYVFDSIKTIYNQKDGKNNIRRINVNIAPLNTVEFKQLNKYNIGTYQLFQETYHEPTYKKLHVSGPKSNYQFRLDAIDRAFESGMQDVGIGILFGLYDYKYEIIAMFKHIEHLEKKYGIGPHTISVPRIEPATGSDLSENPPYPIDDLTFKKIIACVRIAVPYTGIILSTRESEQMRTQALELGVSQISAGSKTNPGGYNSDESLNAGEQFSLGDHRPLNKVIEDIVNHKHIPSFCTGCYRLGRVGKDFMDLAKPGLIKHHCLPNAIFSFSEYLSDYADDILQKKGFDLINEVVKKEISDENMKVEINKNIVGIKAGKRDVYI